MNKRTSTLVLLIIFTMLLAGGLVLYNFLGGKYDNDNNDSEFNDSDNETQESTVTKPPTGNEMVEQAPDFTVQDTNGNDVTLSSFIGSPIVLNFWATWCGPCKYEMPYFDKAFKEYKDEVTFVMVNLTDGVRDTKKKVDSFIKDNSYTFPYYLDTKLKAADTYEVSGIPTTVFINSEGAVVEIFIGSISEKALYNNIKSLIVK